MYCSKCGKEIEENEKFCSYCGTKTEYYHEEDKRNFDFIELVEKVKSGNENAFNEIYHVTYKDIWKITKSFFPNNLHECDECIQDIYLALYEKINQFQSEKGKFLPWLKRIAQNTCINHWNKNKNIQKQNISMEAMTDNLEPNFEFEDEKIEFNPEAVIDRAETSKLVNEILDSLSEQQKQCILLFYANEYDQEEIAKMLDIPKGTVKSRLFHGRKIVEEKVLALEKQGTKLFGMAPITFFMWIFAEESKAQAADKLVWNHLNVIKQIETEVKEEEPSQISNQSTPHGSTHKKNISTRIKTVTANKAIVKTISAIVGASVIGGGAFLFYQNTHEKDKLQKPVEEENIAEKNLEENKKSSDSEIMDSATFYQDLINAYGDFFYNLEETEGVLTEDIIFDNSYGFSNPYTGYLIEYSVDTPYIYYTIVDINKDGFEEILFSGDTPDGTEAFGMYDIWTRDETEFRHVISGAYRCTTQLCGDGTIAIYGSGGFDTGGYDWYSFDNQGNATVVDTYYYDTDHPYNSEEETSYFNQHGKFMEKLEWTQIPSEINFYQDLIDAYGKYYYIEKYTEGVLTKESIDSNKYGVGDPLLQDYVSANIDILPSIYYTICDINNDKHQDIIFSGNIPGDMQPFAMIDIWTRNETEYKHVLSGAYQKQTQLCGDGTVSIYEAAENDMLGYKCFTFNNNGDVSVVDKYLYSEECPYDEEKEKNYLDEHGVYLKNLRWLKIPSENI